MTKGTQTFARVVRCAHRRGRRSLRYSSWIAAMALLMAALRCAVAFWRCLDDLLHRGYRDVAIEAPVYVMGNPRSGTTCLHRLLALDPRFTTLGLYETLLPSVALRRAVRLLGDLDVRLGGALRRAVEQLDGRIFEGWKGIHDAGLGKPEEDEMLFLYAMRSPALLLLFPFVREFPEACFVDQLPVPARRRLARSYRRDLQRHLFASPPGSTLLAKNVLAGGRTHFYREALPDIRMVHILRHPYDAIPSAISMLSRPWRLFNPKWEGDTPESRELARLLIDYLYAMASFADSLDPSQVHEVRYEDLVNDPEGAVRGIYAHFGLELDDIFAEGLKREAASVRRFRSEHHYALAHYGLDADEIYTELEPLFERYGWSRQGFGAQSAEPSRMRAAL